MGQLDQVRENLRRAYESGRDSVRQARAARAGEDEIETVVRPVSGPPRTVVVTRPSVSRDDQEVPTGLRIAAAWAWRILLLLLAAAAVLWVMARLEVVVVPLVISLLLCALLSPLVGLLRRWGVPRSLATIIVVVGGLAAVVAVLTLVINQFVDGAPELGDNAAKGIGEIQAWLRDGPLNLSQRQLNEVFDGVRNWLGNNQQSVTESAFQTANAVFHALAGIFLVLFSTFFFLRDGRRISRFLIGLFPEAVRDRLASASDVSWSTLVSYVRATVLVAFIDAVGIGLALVILKVPFALPLAALVFLGAFIPIVGATLSGAVAVLVALVERGLVVALILLAAVILVQQIEGHVLQPLIMGRAVAIHPLAVIVAIAAGVVLAGIFGALIAVPIVAVLNTGLRHLSELRRAEAAGVPPPNEPEPTGPPTPAGATAE